MSDGWQSPIPTPRRNTVAPVRLFLLSKVPSSLADEAFSFHETVAADDPHLWPRTRDQFARYAVHDGLYAAWDVTDDAKELVAVLYLFLEEEPPPGQWEIGGLTVTTSAQRLGVGTLLVRFALAHTMVAAEPFLHGQMIVAHVEQHNLAPRGLLDLLGFKLRGRVTVPAGHAPPTMTRDADGNLVGDEFEFDKNGLKRLAGYFDTEFTGLIESGDAAMLDWGIWTDEQVRDALNHMAKELE